MKVIPETSRACTKFDFYVFIKENNLFIVDKDLTLIIVLHVCILERDTCTRNYLGESYLIETYTIFYNKK